MSFRAYPRADRTFTCGRKDLKRRDCYESRTRKIFTVHIAECGRKNHDKAKELLNESFAKQDDGTFNQEHMMTFSPRMLALIKPENVEQVKNIMMNHKAKNRKSR